MPATIAGNGMTQVGQLSSVHIARLPIRAGGREL